MLGVLAKAKRLDNGEWIEGYYVCQHEAHQIYILDDNKNHEFDSYHIDVDTLCICTGVKDINNKTAWTHDVIRPSGFIKIGEVMFEDCCFVMKCSDGVTYQLNQFKSFTIIGNTIDIVAQMEESL